MQSTLSPTTPLMPFYKKILIMFIVGISAYVLWRLFYRRQLLLTAPPIKLDTSATDPDKGAAVVEHFTNAAAGLPQKFNLSNYYVKSSYNTCLGKGITGTYLGLDVLSHVLQLGYRFIDFELCKNNGEIYVCANENYYDDSNQNNIGLIKFADAITIIKTVGLTNTGKVFAYNYYEPLFIHLRIKTNEITDTKTLYNDIDTLLQGQDGLTNFLTTNGVSWASYFATNSKNLLDFIGNNSCFVIIDKTHLKNTYNESNLNSANYLTSGLNMTGVDITLYTEIPQSTVAINSNGTINSSAYGILISNDQTYKTNHYPKELAKAGIQFGCMNAILNDDQLSKNNMAFVISSNNMDGITGFMLMSKVINLNYKILDIKGEIKRGVYISIGIVFTVAIMTYFYGNYGNVIAKVTQGGGGVTRRRGGGAHFTV
jgi:hypothetical protein